ncbi:MAG: SPOR domain-containing protein [Gammaproteobacteria bacterium]|nr:SPOR domain-containing protein [Gammaproteobacteria bacterium]
MPQDHATRRSRSTRTSIPGWVWFVTGLVTGIFGSFLYHIWDEVPVDPKAQEIAKDPSPADSGEPTPMEWDFYDIFPKSEVPVIEEYRPDGTKKRLDNDNAYLLQAGSFRDVDDADSLRAELILLGMDVFVREIDRDGESWHRVLVGPLDSETEVSRHRRALAEANIPSIVLRIPKG